MDGLFHRHHHHLLHHYLVVLKTFSRFKLNQEEELVLGLLCGEVLVVEMVKGAGEAVVEALEEDGKAKRLESEATEKRKAKRPKSEKQSD